MQEMIRGEWWPRWMCPCGYLNESDPDWVEPGVLTAERCDSCRSLGRIAW